MTKSIADPPSILDLVPVASPSALAPDQSKMAPAMQSQSVEVNPIAIYMIYQEFGLLPDLTFFL